MVLPILVLPEPAATTAFDEALLPATRHRTARSRIGTVGAARSEIVHRWRAALRINPTPENHRLGAAPAAGRTGKRFAEAVGLFDDCCHLLRALLRRQRRQLSAEQRRSIPRIARTFDVCTTSIKIFASDDQAVAWMLASMYWQGFRHPMALLCTSVHPPTGLVRWLSGFSVAQQADHHDLVQRALASEIDRIQRQALRLIQIMLRSRASARPPPVPIVLLPELLR